MPEIIIMKISSWYSSEGGVSNHFFRDSLDGVWRRKEAEFNSYLTQVSSPLLNIIELSQLYAILPENTFRTVYLIHTQLMPS